MEYTSHSCQWRGFWIGNHEENKNKISRIEVGKILMHGSFFCKESEDK